MKAVIYERFGPPEVLRMAEIAQPIPAKNEVRIKIMASSVTQADCYMRQADSLLGRLVLGFRRPRRRYQILGTEFSGVIDAMGMEVTTWKIGEEVYGFRGFGTGTYAEYKCMPANGSLAAKPGNITFEVAAATVDGATTALFFLRDKAHMQPGQKVLINGASGSIGTFAVQLAKYYGAEVTGVCSGKNVELVRSLGADRVIDYTREDFTTGDAYYDIIFDTVNKTTYRKCKGILTTNGIFMATDLNLKALLQSIVTKWTSKKKVLFGMSVHKTGLLQVIKGLVEAGHLETLIDRTYSLDQIAEAHAYVEQGHKVGNVVVLV
jgi:NADPH:quinone reductase-like Zn-dependent oxidoreductase